MRSVEEIARICHEVNREYCEALGDWSQPCWVDAADWQRESAIRGVQYLLQNPDAGPSACHDNWLADKAADGWVYGEAKDPEKKTHPCMVAFSDLPPEQRAKDYLFHAVVRGLT